MSNFVIVELIDAPADCIANYAISRVIRTYLSKQRAGEDLDLLRESAPDRRFDIIEVPHIDS